MIFSTLFQEVNDFELPGLPVGGTDSDMTDKSNEETEETDALDVCALCDNGGNVIWYVNFSDGLIYFNNLYLSSCVSSDSIPFVTNYWNRDCA